MTATRHHEARSTRERILDAAERRAAAVGMTRLRVGQVAVEAGVSRQTVYNEFGDKFGLGQALAVRIANRLLDTVEGALSESSSIVDATTKAMTFALRAAQDQPLIRLALDRDEHDDMLTLLTTDASPVIETARHRLSVMIMRMWPAEHPDDVDLAVDMAVRLAISHILCPTEPVEESARKLAAVIEALRTARRNAG